MPIEERGRQRRRAERADQRLALVLVAEGLQKRELTLVHSNDPPRSDQKLQMLRVPLGGGPLAISFRSLASPITSN